MITIVMLGRAAVSVELVEPCSGEMKRRQPPACIDADTTEHQPLTVAQLTLVFNVHPVLSLVTVVAVLLFC